MKCENMDGRNNKCRLLKHDKCPYDGDYVKCLNDRAQKGDDPTIYRCHKENK